MSTDRDELAHFLVVLNSIHLHKDTNNLDAATRGERCRQINSWGILSLRAIASVVGCSIYQVERALTGAKKPKARGALNPLHLSMLGYMVSSGRVNTEWLEYMLDNGTSLSTIADLTGIAESTLYRHRRKLD